MFQVRAEITSKEEEDDILENVVSNKEKNV